MADIQTIPVDELLADKEASRQDIKVCELAIVYGHTTYSGGSVQDRLDTNIKIIAKIDVELERRGLGWML